MLKRLQRNAHQIRLLIDTLPDTSDIVECTCREPEHFWENLCKTYDNLLCTSGMRPSQEENISFYTLHRVNTTSLPLPSSFQRILAAACIYAGMDSFTGVPLRQLWITFVACIAATLGHRPMICTMPGDTTGAKRLFIQLCYGDSTDWQKTLDMLLQGFSISVAIYSFPAEKDTLHEVLSQNWHEADEFYLRTDTDWTEHFISNLGDDASRTALENFLRQRFWAKVFWGTDNYYTMSPPASSARWRWRRYKALLRSKAAPRLDAPKRTERLLPFFLLHTFAWEQYAVPGLIEVRPGSVVFDVGAGIGDTAVYFSQKMHNSGHIFAFEPLSINLASLRKNLLRCGCHNVTPVPCALAEVEKDLIFQMNESVASTSVHSLQYGEEGQMVRATTVDTFACKENTHVDFIKADIEGAELDMLRGASETLRHDKPICSLAMYHKQEDFRSLPQFLEKCCPEYIFYIRCEAEPMLFAVCR